MKDFKKVIERGGKVHVYLHREGLVVQLLEIGLDGFPSEVTGLHRSEWGESFGIELLPHEWNHLRTDIGQSLSGRVDEMMKVMIKDIHRIRDTTPINLLTINFGFMALEQRYLRIMTEAFNEHFPEPKPIEGPSGITEADRMDADLSLMYPAPGKSPVIGDRLTGGFVDP